MALGRGGERRKTINVKTPDFYVSEPGEGINRLSANENRYGCSPNVLKALQEHAGEFSC